MHFIRSPSSWLNLPRDRGVSYAAQESWILNDTIKNNILYNESFNSERYAKVIHQCCLERDLELFEAGDETEVGEKGLTLSGGQKARVTLARAIYSQSGIVLLDDVLAALDVHTAKWIVDKCFSGSLVKDGNRTVVLVTHNVALTKKIADHVVSVGLDGRVHSQPSLAEALEEDETLAEEVGKDREALDSAEKPEETASEVVDGKKVQGKLIMSEEIAVGRVSWHALKIFLAAHSKHPALFFTILVAVTILNSIAARVETWYLGYWASQYGHGFVVPVFKYVGIFCELQSDI
ncbi:unnamed protein product [Mycena citricolor]|uniref:ABC transporter domain-containing protein n=1 Tax=Mycena citricolor TaxID=2018698 RepID=A0AAD2HWC5_9AGAR|nr:unnamed protein product [Mycena citricolor]